MVPDQLGGSATWTLDPERPSGPYQALAEHLSEVGPRKLAPRTDLREVAEAIADLLDLDDPPLRTTVGAMPLLVDDMSLDEYERQLFEFYELDAFWGPR